jgi:hypothetical protein
VAPALPLIGAPPGPPCPGLVQAPLVSEDRVTDVAVTGPLGAAVEGAAVDGAADPEAPAARVPLKTRAHSPTARLFADTVVVME